MRQAFSLVELSIVLVILGLLTGGILAGQALIQASQLRAVSTEYGRFVGATAAFRDKYNGLPGDLRDATSYWDELATPAATCAITESTGTATCNGDGSGRVYNEANTSYSNEYFRFWQHLANAGLIQGQYTGRSDAATLATYGSTGGKNVPASKYPEGLWFVAFDGSSGSAMFDAGIRRHNFRIGKANAGSWPAGALLTTQDAWNLDKKSDDGNPATGSVTSTKNSYMAGCTDGDTNTAAYKLNQSGAQCILFFDPGF